MTRGVALPFAPAATRGGPLRALTAVLGARWLWAWRVEEPQTPPAPERPPDTSTNPPPDAAMGAAGGTDEAFEAFVRAHERSLFAFLWRSTGDTSTADDLRQETFIRAWRHFARVRAYERPLAWLYHVAANLVLNYRRDLRPDAAPLTTDDMERAASSPGASDPAGRLAERDLVRATLLSLPPRERAALALRSGQGLSCEEVAATLNITPAAARTLLWRARDHFRAAYLRASADPADQTDQPQQGGAQ